MRRLLLSGFAAVLCACGGSSTVDYAKGFLGTWTGTITSTDAVSGTVNKSKPGSITLTEFNVNGLSVSNACTDGSGPTATVTSATHFETTVAYVCPPDTTETTCASIVFTYNSLSGTLNGSTLSFTSSVTAVGCGNTEDLIITMTGGTKS